MVNNVQSFLRLKENTTITLGFRFLQNHTTDEVDKWILDNFNEPLTYGCISTYYDWGGAIDTSVQLSKDAKFEDIKQAKVREGHCIYPLLYSQIAVSGNVKFCNYIDYNDSIDEITCGNFKNSHLADIYNGSRAKQLWRNGFSKCKECTIGLNLEDLPNLFPLLNEPLITLHV